MTGSDRDRTTVGEGTPSPADASAWPLLLGALSWMLWLASLAALGNHVWGRELGHLAGLLNVDGLAVGMWTVVTFFAAIVTTYARRYMAGNEGLTRFLATVLGFTLAVATLAAADHVALFAAAWVAMGLAMAELIGHARRWPQAREAAATARKSFLASSAFVSLGLGVLATSTGTWTVSGILAASETIPRSAWLLAVAALVVAAAIQCALMPFHAWLLSSMTAPTPASALMHAGFVNAGGFLLARAAPLLVLDPGLMLAIAVLGAASAVVGKLMRTVQADVKSRLGCSTVGQMGFMIMQAGLGLFAAAITHLVLHGFYKAYRFLSAGARVEQTHPEPDERGPTTAVGWIVTGLTGVAGGAAFVLLTGKGWGLDAGLLLMGLVVLASLHGTREVVRHTQVARSVRYGLTLTLTLVAVATYAAVYKAVHFLMADLPLASAPVELTAVHGVLAAAFLAAYLVTETALVRRSRRLYVWLVNAARPKTETVLASTEDYRDH